MATITERSTSPEGTTARDLPPTLQQISSLDWLFDDDFLGSHSSYFEYTPNMSSRGSPGDYSRDSPNDFSGNSPGDNFIDLTGDSSPLPAARPQSQGTSRSDQEPERKRRRVAEDLDAQPGSSSTDLQSRPATQPAADLASPGRDNTIDEVDLTRIEDDADLRRHREERARRQKNVEEQQQQLLNDSIASQPPISSGSSTLSQLSCIICMETITDLTATHCGHIFCHTCIMEALIAGENQGGEPGKGRSRCPVCRERVVRKPAGKRHPEVIPLELKLKIRNEKGKGKQRDTETYADPPIGD